MYPTATTTAVMYGESNSISLAPNVMRRDRISLKKTIVGTAERRAASSPFHPIREDFYLCFVIACRATESVERVSIFFARGTLFILPWAV